MRHIRQIIDLPVSQLSDEEIVKAAMYRLKSKAVILAYDDAENKQWIFLSRWRKGGMPLVNRLKKAWEDKFGPFKKIE